MEQYPLAVVDAAYRWAKKNNPESVGDASLKEWSERKNKLTKSQRFSEGAKAGFLQRSVLAVDRPFQQGAEATGEFLRDKLGDDNFLGKTVSKAGEFVVGSVPSTVGSLAAVLSRTPQGRILKSLPLAAYGMTSNYNQTRDLPSAAVSGATLGATPAVAAKLTSKVANPLGKALTGQAVGFAQDLAEVGAAPTSDPDEGLAERFVPNITEFLSDPTNVAALMLAEAPMAAAGKLAERGLEKKAERDQVVASKEGLFADKSSRANQKAILENEYALDIPNDVTTSSFNDVIETAKRGETSEAQVKLYEMSQELSENQKARLADLKKESQKTTQEFLDKIDRDEKTKKPYPDEIRLDFGNATERKQWLSTNALQSSTFMNELGNFREVDDKIFYKGDNLEVLAELSKEIRRREEGSFSIEEGSSFSNLDPEILARIKQDQFLYDNEVLYNIKNSLNVTEEISTRDYINRIKDSDLPGSDFDAEIVARFLERIGGKDRLIDLFEQDLELAKKNNRFVAGRTNAEGKISLSKDLRTTRQAIGTLAHEITHSSLKDFKARKPDDYKRLVGEMNTYTSEEFKGLINEANKLFGMKLDPLYLAGDRFDKNVNNYSERVAEERLAAISDIYAQAKLQGRRPSIMKILPLEVQQYLLNLFDKLKNSLFSSYGVSNLFTTDSQALFNDLVKTLEKEVFSQVKQAEKVSKVVRSSKAFDKYSFGDNSQQELLRNDSFKLEEGDDVVDTINVVNRDKMTFLEKHLWSNLSLTKTYPVARELFDALHSYRNNIQKRMMQYFSDIGQNLKGDLPVKESLHNWENWISATATNEKKLSAIGDVFQEDQKRREDNQAILSDEELQQDYKLGDEDILMINRLRELTEKVAYQEFLDMSHRDTLHVAAFLLSQTGMTKAQAENLGKFATLLSNDLGKLSRQAKTTEDPTQKLVLEREYNIKRAQLEERLAGELDSLEVETSENFTTGLMKLIEAQVDQRYDHLEATSKRGYAPMSRRGNWLIEFTTLDAEGNRVKKLDSGKSEKDAKARWLEIKKSDPNATSEVISEKSTLESYYRHYTSGTLADIRSQYRQKLEKIFGEMGELTPEQTQIVDEIRNSYGDMDREIRDAIGTKADPFKLKRKNVGGFNKYDFLPNIFDYVSIKTIIGHKGITQARAKLEMAQPEFFNNKDLIEHFGGDRGVVDYTLNANESEWTLPRKLVYFNFLGFSVRHLMQNVTQPIIIGLPELSGLLANPAKAASTIPQALEMVRKWNFKGTTGDSRIDKLFRQAEDEQALAPSMLQHYVPGDEIEFAGQSTMKYLRGKGDLGKKVKIQTAKAAKSFQNAMQVTAEASEAFNRQVSFMMRILSMKDNLGTQVDLENTYRESLKFVDDVNFVGDKSNRPGFVRKAGSFHGMALFSMSLMSFVINHLSLMNVYKKQFFKGSVDPKTYKNRGDQFKRDNPGLWGGMMAFNALMLFSGAMGMPFAQDIDELFETVFGIKYSEAIRTGIIKLSDAFDLGEETGDVIGDTFMTGIGSNMGVGFSDSVGLGRIFSYQTGQPFTFWNALGAGGAVIERGLKAGEALSEGIDDRENWERALRRAGPAGWQYWNELGNLLKENKQLDSEGRVVSNDLDYRANLSRLAGFTPSEVIQDRSSSFRLQRMERKFNKERINKAQSIGRLLAEYYDTEDVSQLEKAQKEFRDFVVKRKLTLSQRDSLVKSISSDVFKRSRQVINLPGVDLSRMLADVQAANPNYKPTTMSKLREKMGEMKIGASLGNPVDFMSDTSLDKYSAYENLVRQGVNPTLAWILVNERFEDLQRVEELGSVNFWGL